MIAFLSKFSISLGTFGKGTKRDLLVFIGGIISLLCLILIWVRFGFVSFIISGLLWFLLTPISDRIVLNQLAKLGVVPKDVELAYELEWQNLRNSKPLSLKDLFKESESIERNIQKARKCIAGDENIKKKLLEWGLDVDNDIDEFINIIIYFCGNVSYRIILKLITKRENVEYFIKWNKLKKELESVRSLKEKNESVINEMSQELEQRFLELGYSIKGFGN